MSPRAEALAVEASRYASQIQSLSTAAWVVMSGDALGDKRQAQAVALDLLDLIGELAGSTAHDVEALEKLCGGG